MSWRLIFVVLLLAAGASAWGGLQLGDWLIAHGPTQAQPAPAHPELNKVRVLDANGKPYVATPPQPLADGSHGVPDIAPPTEWHIEPQSLMDEHRPIALATTTITEGEAAALAQGGMPGGGLQGIATIGALGGDQPIQPIEMDPQPPAEQTPVRNDNHWQEAFHAELKACEDVGFFSRPTCSWNARNKYCAPHNAWGKVDGCPAKRSGF